MISSDEITQKHVVPCLLSTVCSMEMTFQEGKVMFGIYARSYIAKQGMYTPEKSEIKIDKPSAYQMFVIELHIARQPCPGSCTEQRCFNSFCSVHPRCKINHANQTT